MKPFNVNGADQVIRNCSGSAFSRQPNTVVYPAIIHPLPDRAVWKRSQTALPTPLFPGESEKGGEGGREREKQSRRSPTPFLWGKAAHGAVPASAAQLQERRVGGLLGACRRQTGTADASAPHPRGDRHPSISLLLSQCHTTPIPKVVPRVTTRGVLGTSPALGTHIYRSCSWISRFLDTA